jgi:hypothetical protein
MTLWAGRSFSVHPAQGAFCRGFPKEAALPGAVGALTDSRQSRSYHPSRSWFIGLAECIAFQTKIDPATPAGCAFEHMASIAIVMSGNCQRESLQSAALTER